MHPRVPHFPILLAFFALSAPACGDKDVGGGDDEGTDTGATTDTGGDTGTGTGMTIAECAASAGVSLDCATSPTAVAVYVGSFGCTASSSATVSGTLGGVPESDPPAVREVRLSGADDTSDRQEFRFDTPTEVTALGGPRITTGADVFIGTATADAGFESAHSDMASISFVSAPDATALETGPAPASMTWEFSGGTVTIAGTAAEDASFMGQGCINAQFRMGGGGGGGGGQ